MKKSSLPADYGRTRLACYTSYFTMSSVFCLPPLLFVTFHETYGVSYTLLGTLVLTNFCIQFSIDLIFTLFSDRFRMDRIIRAMPLITSAGLTVYALVPAFFPRAAYAGLLAGTVIFSASAGMSEVLVSPMVAAIPSDDPQRDMSTLHSLYAFGFFMTVAVSTLFFKIFGRENWMYLTLFFALLPVAASVMFTLSPIPDMRQKPEAGETAGRAKRRLGIALCTGCIFFGGCAENTMANWVSGYTETALSLDKTVGDILGMAVFAILLGSARILYARFGKKIERVLIAGMIGATVCYVTAGLSTSAVPALAACMLTGLFTSMLWPGTLILMEKYIPGAGVAAYALMAAGGDFGAAVAPQLLGAVVDGVSSSGWAAELGNTLGFSAEQIGLRTGMLVIAVFPLIGAALVIYTIRYLRGRSAREKNG